MVLPPRSPQEPKTVAAKVSKIKGYTIPMCSMEYNQKRGWMEQPLCMSLSLPIKLLLCQQAYTGVKMLETESKVHSSQ